jgi:hypothetical protein
VNRGTVVPTAQDQDEHPGAARAEELLTGSVGPGLASSRPARLLPTGPERATELVKAGPWQDDTASAGHTPRYLSNGNRARRGSPTRQPRTGPAGAGHRPGPWSRCRARRVSKWWTPRPEWLTRSAPRSCGLAGRAGTTRASVAPGSSRQAWSSRVVAGVRGACREHRRAGVSCAPAPVGEHFRQGYRSTPVAVCGEPVTSDPDGEEDPTTLLPRLRA